MTRIVLIAIALVGCTRATVIGTPCITDKNCNVKGQRCVAGPNGGAQICTHACTGQTGADGCPIGYDCTAADPSSPTVLTCNKESFAFDAHYAQCIIEDNPEPFSMETYSMGKVVIDAHTFFMGMYANEVSLVSIRCSDGPRLSSSTASRNAPRRGPDAS